MSSKKSFTVLLSLICIVVDGCVALAQSPPLTFSTGASPATEVIRKARFAEPLIATTRTTLTEDQALANALIAFAKDGRAGRFQSLTSFLAGYPRSGWSSALQTNLGLSYLHQGRYSKALATLKGAWEAGKDAREVDARLMVDRAVGELAQAYASLGKMAELEALFSEIGTRAVGGPATESIQSARETLTLSKKDPQHLFNCGPLALQSLAMSQGISPEQVRFLQWYQPGPNGTNLAEVAGLATKAGIPVLLVERKIGQPVPVPSIIHFRTRHFAAIVEERNGEFRVKDPINRSGELWMTSNALDSEASGYFLTLADSSGRTEWRAVDLLEAAQVWGKGATSASKPGGAGDLNASSASEGSKPPSPPANPNFVPGGGKGCPLCSYDIKESSVSVSLSDVPVGYVPPIGPPAKLTISYNQREDSQPATFSFFNVGPKWTLNWISYVTDDPLHVGSNVTRFLPGGGSFIYSGYSATSQQFAAQDDDGSLLVLTSQTPITYEHWLKDGSKEIYTQSDGNSAFPRNIFLTQIVDPQGNALTLSYDAQFRVTTATDAVGRQTTLTYGVPTRPLLVTKVTDPFGRSAQFTYDTSGRLVSITDILGLTSSFTYDSNSLVNSMTTPYGTTVFSYTAPGSAAPPRFIDVTDPLGFHEREEWLEPSYNSPSDPPATVPVGMPITQTNNYFQYRNSFHWDKNAYVLAGCTPTGGCDYTKARDRQFYHMTSLIYKGTGLNSTKYPLENRIWYAYPGQTVSNISGIYAEPSATGRVLDDGTTQLSQVTYDTAGFFKPIQFVDPLGRTTNLTYLNHIDLASITQSTAFGTQTVIAQYGYNYQHRPVTYIDAAGQTTNYAYNALGQLTSVTNPLRQVTTYQYDAAFNLSAVINANNLTAATYTYDSYARVRTFTDSEGWTVTYDYDAADRITKKTYPDGTFESYAYDKLDLASYTDREARTWAYAYDANRRLIAVTDPLGNQTQYGYNDSGQVTSLTDPKTNVTQWAYDVQGRLTSKQYPDTSTVTYTYETTTSRLKSVTDALAQVKTYAYAKDDRLTGLTYTGAVNPTPNVGFTWDPYFPRLTAMTDGTGTRQYAYVPVGSPGALQLQQDSGPLPASAITSAYDALGRLSQRTVQGAGAETFQYDAIGRLAVHANDLGSFTLGYLGQTDQITSRQLASSTLATTWSYLGNTGDRRLAGIANTGLTAGQFSTFTYTTTPENFITGITESSDAASVYPASGSQSATYNTLNQLTDLSGQALTYDANGNLTADGQRTYAWDAENRLVGIGYPGVSGKATAFTYDGLSRRATVSSTPPGGGSAAVTSYLWCGDDICQARGAGNTTIRSYYDEGEYLPGTPAQTLYYGIDQIGSVRRVFTSTSSAPTYSYDPYGVPLQVTAPKTDFVFGGMFFDADSGLYLTNYRAFDPIAGRWLSRDPDDEESDPYGNLYSYVNGNPVGYFDPLGLGPFGAATGAIIGGEAGAILGGAAGLVCTVGAVICVPGGAAGGYVGGAVFGAVVGNAIEDMLTFKKKKRGKGPALEKGDDKEHTKNARPSTEGKHQGGKARKRQDYGNEKADQCRRWPRKPPDKNYKGPWPPRD